MCLPVFYGNSFLDSSNWVGGFVYGFLMGVQSFQHMCVRSHISAPASCMSPVCSNSDSAFLSQNSKGFCARLTTAPLREAEPALACQAWSQTLGGNAKCNMGPSQDVGAVDFLVTGAGRVAAAPARRRPLCATWESRCWHTLSHIRPNNLSAHTPARPVWSALERNTSQSGNT